MVFFSTHYKFALPSVFSLVDPDNLSFHSISENPYFIHKIGLTSIYKKESIRYNTTHISKLLAFHIRWEGEEIGNIYFKTSKERFA